MKLNKEIVAQKLLAYLQRRLTLDKLVDWAEDAIREGDFPEDQVDVLMDVLGQIGLADVKTFGLTWEDCSSFMERMGYVIKVEAGRAA